VSGQNYDSLARVVDGQAVRFIPMPTGSGPHGLAFDPEGRLWVTLEFAGKLRAIAADGRMLAVVDVTMPCAAVPGGRTNPRPHGLAVGPGRTLWFTGKATGTLGRVAPDGKVTHVPLPAGGKDGKPIYIHAGPDGAMWATELVGNRIARVAPDGKVAEFAIPTPNSRPIAIVPGPDGAMWFSEEAGSKVARIDKDGRIREIAVPRGQTNLILAGLAFDRDGNLWTQQYVDHNNPAPAGSDSLVRIDKAGLAEGAAPGTGVTFYPVPTPATVMHRIALAPDGALRFTEMHADQLGRIMPPN
jgi:virginiamycin B lyase